MSITVKYDVAGNNTFTANWTQYVQECSISRGFPDERARMAEVGRCVLTLNNSDKRFSPAFTGGAYYGNLLPFRRVRIEYHVGLQDFTIFYGYLRTIEPAPGVRGEQNARIVFEDAFCMLARDTLALPIQENKTADDLLRTIFNAVWGGVYATGTITFDANPTAAETVTVGDVVYTFGAGERFTVAIGAAKEDTAANLVEEINGRDKSYTKSGTYSVNAAVSASVSAAVVTITANIPGTSGNSIALATDSGSLTLSGATLTGGADAPAGFTSFDTGKQTFDTAADTWDKENTKAIEACRDAVYSEYGLLWVSKAGVLTFKNREYEFTLPQTATTLTVVGNHAHQRGSLSDERVKNRIIVTYSPRGTEAAGVVARASGAIKVMGVSGLERWNASQGYIGNSGSDAPQPGDRVVRLPFREIDSGRAAGGKNIITPISTTDYTVNDQADNGGFDYTSTGRITTSVAVDGSAVEVTFKNTAMGPLYIFGPAGGDGLQVRGTLIVAWDELQEIREDDASITAYGRRVWRYDLALPSTTPFAESLAEYLLGRYKTPAYVVDTIDFVGMLTGASLLTLDIGSIVAITEDQTGVSAARYYVRGINLFFRGDGQDIVATARVKTISDQTYWILENATYSVLGSTTRLAI